MVWLVAEAMVVLGVAVSVGEDTSMLALAAITIVQIAFVTVGAVVATRLPGNVIGWLFLAVGLMLAASMLTGGYATRAVLPQSDLPAGVAAAVVFNLLQGPLLIGLLGSLLLVFPDGHLPSPRWRAPARALAAGCIAATVATLVAPGSLNIGTVTNPLALGGAWASAALAVQGAGFVGMVAVIVIVAIAQVRRFRLATGELRQQLKWLVAATSLMGLTFGGAIPLWSASGAWSGVVWVLLFAGATASLPVATGFAILRYRLYEIDVVIRRTVSYATLLAVLATMYLVGVAAIGALLRQFTGGSSGLAVSLSTLAVAAAFQPARRRIQRAVDHRFYRDRYDAVTTLDAFSGRLREEVDLDALTGDVIEVVNRTLHPSHVSVWLRPVGSDS